MMLEEVLEEVELVETVMQVKIIQEILIMLHQDIMELMEQEVVEEEVHMDKTVDRQEQEEEWEVQE